MRSIVKPLLVAAGLLALVACNREPDLPDYSLVSNFKLTDQHGQPFDSASLKDRVWIADFFFTTCPGPCPLMSSKMHKIQMELEQEGIRLVSISVDPDHDTPAALDQYAHTFKASPGVWEFLTGPIETIDHLSNDVFKLGPVETTQEHSTRFVLVDGDAHIRGYYLSSEPNAVPRVIADARRLLHD